MIKIIALFVVFSFVLTFAQDQNSYEKKINIADNLAYNFQFDSSQTIISQSISLASHRPEAFQLLSKIYLWYSLGSKDEENVKAFFSYSDSAIYKCDKLLDENSEDKNILYILGNIYKYRAMVYGSKGNTLDAFWATKKSVSFFEDVIELDSNFFSAYGGIGIFEYALSYVPALFDWALTISGLSADKNNGYKLIEKAYEKGKQDRIEYQFHLAKLTDEYYADYPASIKLLKELIKKYPNNSLFHYQLAIEYIKNRNLNKAEIELDKVLELNHPKFIQTNSFSYFLKGDISFRKSNWERALEYYQKFIQSTESIDYTGIASLRSAYCYYFLENENKFKKYLLLSSNGNNDLEDDNYANEMSELILKKGMDEERKFVIELENASLRGDNNFAIQNSDSISKIESKDLRAEALFYLSNALINKNKFEEAKKAANAAKAVKLTDSFWIKPFSLVNLALINYKTGKEETAKELLLIAENINEYRKKNLIQSLINNLKRELEIK